MKIKTYLKALSIFFFLFGIIRPATATMITLSTNTSADGTNYVSPYADYDSVIVEDFDDYSAWWTPTGSGTIVTGSAINFYYAPYGALSYDMTPYLTVPQNSSAATYYSASLEATYNYFGIWWGSIDTYNSLQFYLNGLLVETISGSDVLALTGGDPTQVDLVNRNIYLNLLELPSFDSFTISSSYAFEADNIAVGNLPVPEPSTMLLLGAGLIGLVGTRKKIKK